MNQRRYVGQPKRLYDFMDYFDVLCPRCQKHGKIDLPHFLDTKNATFKCQNCHFSEKANDRLRFRSVAKTKCINCENKLEVPIEGRKKIPKYIVIPCQICNTRNRIAENWETYFLKYNESGIVDPVFGLPLYYQMSFRNEIFWAYNDDHLREIRNYVASELRERSTNKFKMTMVEKLPQFIKEAKNRTELIKLLDKHLRT